jgi:lysozyme
MAATSTTATGFTNSVAIAADLIRSFEGLRLEPYYCPAKKLTIGYSHLIRAGEHFGAITPDKADELLNRDIRVAQNGIYRLCRVSLSPQQEAALISFVFNLGSGAFQASTLRQKLNRGEYLWAADEFLRWVYTGGVKLAGLIRRRAAERATFLVGTR